MRAHCQGAATSATPAPYLDRNRAIVDACDILYATPESMAEESRGGMWHTVRYARRVGKPVVIVWPDGTVGASHPPGGSASAAVR